MSTDAGGDETSEWAQGIMVLVVVAIFAVAGGFGLDVLDVPFGLYIGAAIGAVVGFLAFSYLYYGR